jgi:MFS family permease
MDTQNTPIHIKLWHKGFWLLSIANMLLTMSVYMLIPILPVWLMHVDKISPFYTGIIMGAYGLGLFVLGPLCSWLVQKYRRSHVCSVSIFVMICSIAGFWYAQRKSITGIDEIYCYIALRVILGATFGLAQMVLSSTLIIDKCESFQRTEANHHASWFGRFALSLGPMLAIVISHLHYNVILISMLLAGVSILLIRSVKFPFRAPDDTQKVFSSDRFFLFEGKRLFLNLVLITSVLGIIMTMPCSSFFYAMIMVGFLLALLSEKFVFADADLKSETVSGLIVICAALIIMLTRRQLVSNYISPLFIGFGIGIIGSRFLLFFIKLSHHCQRGTSQSTFFIAWEFGISLGLFLGYAFFYGQESRLLVCCIILTSLALILYNFFTHPWYIAHKNR